MKDILWIDRSKWVTGNTGKGDSQLLNKEGYMCCLGFRCNQMGIPKTKLFDVGNPEHLDWDIPDLNYEDVVSETIYNTKLTNSAMEINDHLYIRPATRERRLEKLFAKHGITVKYTGKYDKED